jgi:RND superfamily putative drug exporter
LIQQFRWPILLAWLALAGVLALVAPAPDTTVGETTDLLPATTPVHVTLEALARHFGDKSALSTIVIVFERQEAPLMPDDLAAIERLGDSLPRPLPGEAISTELAAMSIHTPAALALAGKGNPLISEDGHAALISISLPYNYITKHAAKLVKHVQAVVAADPLLPGLSAEVTGSAGYGYDYSIATERSHQKTLGVTLISVIVILLMVYRAPIAALLPLGAISMAAAVVFKLLAFAESFGVHSGTAEQIFTFVLLYGAGIDYSLLFMSRYREFLLDGHSSDNCIALALDASAGAIASSSLITVSGLVMLCFARFSVFRHAGPAVVLALLMAAFSALTLVPAILAIVGPIAFWPGSRPSRENQSGRKTPLRSLWPLIAQIVVDRPRLTLLVTLAALLLPAIRGLNIDWSYDALYSLKPAYQARRGTEMAARHWPAGECAPITVLAVADRPLPASDWLACSNQIISVLHDSDDVDNIRALPVPLGTRAPPEENAAVALLARDKVNSEYLSADGKAMRLYAVLKVAPLNWQAMDDVGRIGEAASRAVAASGISAKVRLAGTTAEMIDTRTITQQDFWHISAMALAAILIVVTLTLRDFPLAIFILAATVLSYLTTLGVTSWVFESLGTHGLDWKVQMLLFIVLVAVGQDYSIFFAMRLEQEARRLPCIEATRRSLIFTGPVISSCGLIMAATLGSLMAGDVQLLVQLGFAFALGMLIDTFLVRPLLLPSLIVLTGRTLQRPGKVLGAAHVQVLSTS